MMMPAERWQQDLFDLLANKMTRLTLWGELGFVNAVLEVEEIVGKGYREVARADGMETIDEAMLALFDQLEEAKETTTDE